nr:MAG TPA: hypothetical protein [Caudoviricetes sp.]
MSKLITSCILNCDWTTCEISFPSFLQYLQKKRRFRSTISDPFSSLSSDFLYWSFFHYQKNFRNLKLRNFALFLYIPVGL